jgi:hypothetical protein
VTASAEIFERQRFAVMRGLVVEPLLGFLWRYTIERAGTGGLTDGDADVPGTPCAYADPVMEHVLERLRPSVQTATGLTLAPTYSYVRVYKPGDALEPHRDRPACEISVSLNLGQDPPTPWPLWIAGPLGPEPVSLEPGDALIYRGVERRHWREAYDGTRLAQVFLHYVDLGGPYAEWKFDKREGLTLTPPLPI